MMVKKVLLFLVISLSIAATTVSGQIVNVPDTNFKSYLLRHGGINTNADNEIQLSEAQAFNGAIDCPNSRIADMTGIEEFTSLTILQCNDNPLTSLNLSNNTALTRVLCNDNALTSLNVSNCAALTILGCNNNSLTSLDISDCTALTYLSCNSNSLTSLNLNNNTALNSIFCGDNRLSSIDLSNNTALLMLQCMDNRLTSLDMSNCPDLTSLMCSENSLTSLDLSGNAALTSLYCDYNLLATLNVKNGNNTNFTSFVAGNNSSLKCVEVDDETYSNTNWTTGGAFRFNAGVRFSENCANTSVDDFFVHASPVAYPNPATNFVTIAHIPDGTVLTIADFTGKTVYSSTVTGGQAAINTAGFANGIYLIRADHNSSSASNRFVVQR